MANYNSTMESARELVLQDKAKIAIKYSPPGLTNMKYIIEDRMLHARYYFIRKKKFNHKLSKLKNLPEFNHRFRIILNK